MTDSSIGSCPSCTTELQQSKELLSQAIQGSNKQNSLFQPHFLSAHLGKAMGNIPSSLLIKIICNRSNFPSSRKPVSAQEATNAPVLSLTLQMVKRGRLCVGTRLIMASEAQWWSTSPFGWELLVPSSQSRALALLKYTNVQPQIKQPSLDAKVLSRFKPIISWEDDQEGICQSTPGTFRKSGNGQYLLIWLQNPTYAETVSLSDRWPPSSHRSKTAFHADVRSVCLHSVSLTTK